MLFTVMSKGQDCQTPPEGWTVRVCLSDTEARGIRLWIGVGGNRDTHRYWKDWLKGEPSEFSLPIDLKYAKEVWIQAQTLEDGRNIYLCLRFNGHTVKHIDCDGSPEEHEKNRDDQDECNCN